jgi:hypothetical protein
MSKSEIKAMRIFPRKYPHTLRCREAYLDKLRAAALSLPKTERLLIKPKKPKEKEKEKKKENNKKNIKKKKKEMQVVLFWTPGCKKAKRICASLLGHFLFQSLPALTPV